MEYDLTWLQVDLDALEDNLRLVNQKAGTDVLAVVKADAYGMGAVTIAHALQAHCAFFGTANITEALELRRSGIQKPILILGRMPVSAYPLAVAEDIRMPIFLYEDAKALSDEAVKQGKTARFHFAVDTGMSRIGFQATQESADLCVQICKLPGLEAEGIFSHFATADSYDLTSAKAQKEKFDAFCDLLTQRGIQIPIRHINNVSQRRGGSPASAGKAGDGVDRQGGLCEDAACRSADQLWRLLHHHPGNRGGYAACGLCGRLPTGTFREILCSDPGQAGSHSGSGLHGSDDGGCDGYSRCGAE